MISVEKMEIKGRNFICNWVVKECDFAILGSKLNKSLWNEVEQSDWRDSAKSLTFKSKEHAFAAKQKNGTTQILKLPHACNESTKNYDVLIKSK